MVRGTIDVFLGLLLAVAVVNTARINSEGSPKRFHLRRHGPPPPPPSVNSHLISQHWITQKLDHFSPLDDRTWKQRYFVADNNFQPGGPVFLYLSGEWEADGGYLTYGLIGKLAAKLNALTIDLEHRFYGESQPTPNTTSANLRYLSSDQALADAAYFADYMNTGSDFDLSSSKWVVFGASYSANLAAWARAKYPHLFHAAHASSGPVLAQLDFPEYLEVVDEALRETDPYCSDTIALGMEGLRNLVEQGESVEIARIFHLCEDELNLSEPDDIMYLYETIASYFMGVVQYALPGDVESVCRDITSSSGMPLDVLAYVVVEGLGACISSDRRELYDYYRDDIFFSSDVTRQWFYQTCTEFGYAQSLSSKDQPFGQVVPVDFSIKWCSEVYGPEFNREVSEAGVARTNLVNGGLTPDVTRVLYTHGSLDPWHALGIQTDLHSEAPAIVITGASHCMDLLAAAPDDSPELTAARVRVSDILTAWLKE